MTRDEAARKLRALAEELELVAHRVEGKVDLGPFAPSIDASVRVIEAEIRIIRGIVQ
jgi:hypothetical protein